MFVVEVDARVTIFFVRLGTVELRCFARRSETRPGSEEFLITEETEAELVTVALGFDSTLVSLDSRTNLTVLGFVVSTAIRIGGGEGDLIWTLRPVAEEGGDGSTELLEVRSASNREKMDDELLVTLSLPPATKFNSEEENVM